MGKGVYNLFGRLYCLVKVAAAEGGLAGCCEVLGGAARRPGRAWGCMLGRGEVAERQEVECGCGGFVCVRV